MELRQEWINCEDGIARISSIVFIKGSLEFPDFSITHSTGQEHPLAQESWVWLMKHLNRNRRIGPLESQAQPRKTARQLAQESRDR